MSDPETAAAELVLPGSLSFGESCFACGLANDQGLKIPYVRVGSQVRATFTLGENFSGAPAYVHGGVVMTVMDEGMAWATIALRQRFAVTRTFTSTFTRPVLVGAEHTLVVDCGELGDDGRTMPLTATVSRGDGKVCASAEATYYAMTVEETAKVSNLPSLPAEVLAAFGRP